MTTNQFKALIIVSVIFFIVCFVIMRIHSIPLEEEALLYIIFFGVFVLVVAAGKIWDARKSNKEDKQENINNKK
jgi:uncharacterized membrane protein YvlD (DUF360 family)